jgi:hypothetical protein
MKMMTRDDIRSELGWTDSIIHSLSRTPTLPTPGVAKTQAHTHMGFTTATECWPSLNRQKAEPPNGDGMRP